MNVSTSSGATVMVMKMEKPFVAMGSVGCGINSALSGFVVGTVSAMVVLA